MQMDSAASASLAPGRPGYRARARRGRQAPSGPSTSNPPAPRATWPRGQAAGQATRSPTTTHTKNITRIKKIKKKTPPPLAQPPSRRHVVYSPRLRARPGRPDDGSHMIRARQMARRRGPSPVAPCVAPWRSRASVCPWEAPEAAAVLSSNRVAGRSRRWGVCLTVEHPPGPIHLPGSSSVKAPR